MLNDCGECGNCIHLMGQSKICNTKLKILRKRQEQRRCGEKMERNEDNQMIYTSLNWLNMIHAIKFKLTAFSSLIWFVLFAAQKDALPV